jgi:hypothetical protein
LFRVRRFVGHDAQGTFAERAVNASELFCIIAPAAEGPA